MSGTRVWAQVLGVECTVVEGVEFDEAAGVLVARVRPRAAVRGRCGICRRRCRGYDAGRRRRWRGLDFATVPVVLEARVPRVNCRIHGVVVAHVPWARHGAGHTLAFDQTVAWLATRTSKAAVCELMRIAWRTVGSIIARVWADTEAQRGDRLEGLVRIGIDEISYKRGHRYLTVVVDHDTGRLVWAGEGRDRATLGKFFTELGPDRCARITHVSADQADWITAVVTRYCPAAAQCADPFHLVAWATEALDEVRRQAWRDARQAGHTTAKGTGRGGKARLDSIGDARRIRRARWTLWKNPQDLTDKQRDKLAWIAKTDPRLYRAYLLKEGLRWVFTVKGQAGKEALDRWLAWAQRCRILAFTHLGRRLKAILPRIHNTLEHELSNGLIESVNTKIRLITRIGYGFHTANAVIALAMLNLAGPKPHLPGRTHPHISQ